MLFVWEVCCFGVLVDLFSVLFCDIMLCELTLLNFLVLCVALRLMFYIKILVYLIVCCVIKRFLFCVLVASVLMVLGWKIRLVGIKMRKM